MTGAPRDRWEVHDRMNDNADHTPERGRGSTPLRSVGHALDVLEAFDLDHPELGVTELARRMGVTPSTIHRALVTLAAHRLVEPTRYRTYRLGVRAIEIGSLALQHRGFGGAIQPAMEELARAVNETVNVAILDGDDILYVAVLESNAVLRPHFAVGQRGPTDRTALGKVFLALDREVSHQPPNLRDELARVRVEQVAYDDEESDPGGSLRCRADLRRWVVASRRCPERVRTGHPNGRREDRAGDPTPPPGGGEDRPSDRLLESRRTWSVLAIQVNPKRIHGAINAVARGRSDDGQ